MKTMKFIVPLMIAVGLMAVSCKKEGCTDPSAINYNEEADKDDGSCEYEQFGTTEVNLKHEFGGMGNVVPFELNTEYIHPMSNDTLTYTKFKYYVSNFKLKKSDGTWWTHPESYFLVDVSDASSTTLTISNIPEGNYTEVSYVMGVDSARNVSGAQTGALSTTNNMFWSWNSGYIMVKAEGTSPNSQSGNFAFHLGGFSGSNNVITSQNHVFGSPEEVGPGMNPTIQLTINPAKMFHTTGSISGNTSIMMPGPDATTMATDFFSAVAFDGIQ
ncbi:MAG: MbnP family protein [Bacteroidota bacterium]